jgi:hypothetical protein
LLQAFTSPPIKAAELVSTPSGLFSQMYKRGSLAMAAGIQAVATVASTSTIELWMPDYFCNDALYPVREMGIDLRFYPVNAQLKVDWAATERLIGSPRSKSIFGLVHYFGFPGETEPARQFCARRSMVLLEDAAHCLRMMPGIGMGDLTVFSPRKLLAAPAGGVLAVQPKWAAGLKRPSVSGNAVAVALWVTVRLAQSTLSRLHVPWHFLPAYRNPPATEAPSQRGTDDKPGSDLYSLRLLNVLHAQTELVVRRRREHYQRLLHWSAKAKVLPVFPEMPDTVCPYVFPMRVGDPAAVVSLFRSGGVPASRWPDLPPEVIRNPEHRPANESYEHIVLLPVHQSLTADDVDRIGRLLVAKC